MRSIMTADYAKSTPFPIEKLSEKDKVLAFMRKLMPFCATAGHFNDIITGQLVEDRSWGWYRYGGWQWSERDAYHVEKCDLELEPEFVAYALKR